MFGDTEMSFKILFFLIVGYGKSNPFVRLKRELELNFVPFINLNVKIDQKTHLIENVVYDTNKDIFIVTLEEDDSSKINYHTSYKRSKEDEISIYNRYITKYNKLVDSYIENGWEEHILTDYKNVITTPEIHEIIIAVNDIKEELKPDAFIEMVSAMMIESKLRGSLEFRELFYFCNLVTCQQTRILERINELQKIKKGQ